jgi:UDP-N-acetylglucosamine 4,6-dehydratase
MAGGEIFIPKMKEYNMLELLRKRYPDAKIKIIGKREGERLHEPIMTEDEKERVKQCDDYFVIGGFPNA